MPGRNKTWTEKVKGEKNLEQRVEVDVGYRAGLRLSDPSPYKLNIKKKCSSNKDKLKGFEVKFYKKKLHKVQIMKNILIIQAYLTITCTEKLKITYILLALYKEIEPE